MKHYIIILILAASILLVTAAEQTSTSTVTIKTDTYDKLANTGLIDGRVSAVKCLKDNCVFYLEKRKITFKLTNITECTKQDAKTGDCIIEITREKTEEEIKQDRNAAVNKELEKIYKIMQERKSSKATTKVAEEKITITK